MDITSSTTIERFKLQKMKGALQKSRSGRLWDGVVVVVGKTDTVSFTFSSNSLMKKRGGQSVISFKYPAHPYPHLGGYWEESPHQALQVCHQLEV